MQLGLHDKPIGLLDVDGYWQPIAQWLARAVREGFVLDAHARAVKLGDEVDAMLDALAP
jgi:predicted Rossmann-fold nucleotide-binding protein